MKIASTLSILTLLAVLAGSLSGCDPCSEGWRWDFVEFIQVRRPCVEI
ncbi:MAG: hypothetical protein ACR2PJ_00645 [Pseudomonadales bacterium]